MTPQQSYGKRRLPPRKQEIAIPRSAKRPNWVWIRQEWEADLKSTRAIATQSTKAGKKISHAAIEKRAHKENWTRKSLAPEVRREVANRLAAAAVDTVAKNGRSAEQVIDSAARQGVEVIRQHRSHIARSVLVVETLLSQLEDANKNATTDLDEVKAIKNAEVRARLMRAIGLGNRATIAKDLVQTTRHLIGLERQAFNLNDKEQAAPDSIEERLARLEDAGS